MTKYYHSLTQLIHRIEEPNQACCLRLWNENKELFASARGSKSNHQAWESGYLDHLTEAMNIAVVLYDAFHSLRPLPFSESDSLLVLYLHDLEKPWKYVKDEQGNRQQNQLLQDKETQIKPFVEHKIKEYSFQLTQDHWNGIYFVEGETGHYNASKRTQGPLAAFCHLCDTTSARIWFDEPRVKGEW